LGEVFFMAGCITARSGSQLRTEYFGFLLTAFLSFFVASASAEIHEVYPGYLVRARSAAATTDGVAAAANARNRFRARGYAG
jgi:hypothetical protein